MAAVLRAVALVCLLLGAVSALNLRTKKRGCKTKQKLDPFDCYTDTGKDYVGLQDMSASGRKCAKWVDKEMPDVGNHNYCRNPDGSSERPWCFTVDPNKEKEDCEIPVCKDAGEPPEKWIAPAGSKSTDEPCEYEPPEKEPKVWKEGKACEDHKGDTWWLIGMKKHEAADAKACMETCGTVAGTEYYTVFSTPDDDGKTCGCYRSCIVLPDDLTVNGPTTYRV